MATKKRKTDKPRSAAKKNQEEKGEKVRITSRDIKITFLAFFFVFMGVGYLRGRAVRNSPERLRMYMGENIRHNSGLLQFAKDSAGKRRIRYTCPNKQYAYDVDDNKVYNETKRYATPGDAGHYEPAIVRDDVFFTTFVVGAFSAWSIKDVFSYVGLAQKGGAITSRVKVIIAAILGTVVGYEIGYWLATRSTPECDYAGYDKLLTDEKEWKTIEEGVWAERVRNAEVGIGALGGCQAGDAGVQRAQDSRLNEALTMIQRLKERTAEVGYDYHSTDFDMLDKFVKVKTEYLKACGGQSSPAR